MDAYSFLDGSYKTLAVVKRECADLAHQLFTMVESESD
jgi:hypothetical protein